MTARMEAVLAVAAGEVKSQAAPAGEAPPGLGPRVLEEMVTVTAAAVAAVIGAAAADTVLMAAAAARAFLTPTPRW